MRKKQICTLIDLIWWSLKSIKCFCKYLKSTVLQRFCSPLSVHRGRKKNSLSLIHKIIIRKMANLNSQILSLNDFKKRKNIDITAFFSVTQNAEGRKKKQYLFSSQQKHNLQNTILLRQFLFDNLKSLSLKAICSKEHTLGKSHIGHTTKNQIITYRKTTKQGGTTL